MPLDMPPDIPHHPIPAEVRGVDVEYEFQGAAEFLGSDPDAVTFQKGDVDIHLGVEFAGNSFDPLTIVSAFIAWIQVRGSFDIAVADGPDVSLGLGAEVFFGRPYFHQKWVEWRTSDEELLEWKTLETGFIPRLTLHVQELSYVDFYAVVFVGPTFGQINANLDSREASAIIRAPGIRGGLGIGGNLVAKYGILIGGELRYEIGTRFLSDEDIALIDSANETVGWAQIERHQRPPRGFSWVFNLGIRL